MTSVEFVKEWKDYPDKMLRKFTSVEWYHFALMTFRQDHGHRSLQKPLGETWVTDTTEIQAMRKDNANLIFSLRRLQWR